MIHDTLAVIANEVKQSSKTKMHFFKPGETGTEPE
jgi:hypothetical protein